MFISNRWDAIHCEHLEPRRMLADITLDAHGALHAAADPSDGVPGSDAGVVVDYNNQQFNQPPPTRVIVQIWTVNSAQDEELGELLDQASFPIGKVKSLYIKTVDSHRT